MSYETVLFLTILYNVVILAGTSYLVFWRNASGWWFLLAILLLLIPNQKLYYDCKRNEKIIQ